MHLHARPPESVRAMSESITIKKLQRELAALKKKLFVYETLQSEKEIKKGKVSGPFKTGEESVKY